MSRVFHLIPGNQTELAVIRGCHSDQVALEDLQRPYSFEERALNDKCVGNPNAGKVAETVKLRSLICWFERS